jgi:hypothetical protein
MTPEDRDELCQSINLLGEPLTKATFLEYINRQAPSFAPLAEPTWARVRGELPC